MIDRCIYDNSLLVFIDGTGYCTVCDKLKPLLQVIPSVQSSETAKGAPRRPGPIAFTLDATVIPAQVTGGKG